MNTMLWTMERNSMELKKDELMNGIFERHLDYHKELEKVVVNTKENDRKFEETKKDFDETMKSIREKLNKLKE